MVSEKKKEYIRKYDAINTKGFYIKLNKKTDADIIDFLEGVDNKQGYIKRLIRSDMATLNEDK